MHTKTAKKIETKDETYEVHKSPSGCFLSYVAQFFNAWTNQPWTVEGSQPWHLQQTFPEEYCSSCNAKQDCDFKGPSFLRFRWWTKEDEKIPKKKGQHRSKIIITWCRPNVHKIASQQQNCTQKDVLTQIFVHFVLGLRLMLGLKATFLQFCGFRQTLSSLEFAIICHLFHSLLPETSSKVHGVP